jgi:hypothetical protein
MPRTKKPKATTASAPERPSAMPAPQSDPERVMVLMALVSQGAQADEVTAACAELGIVPDLVRQTIEGLEANARVLRAALEMLDPQADDEDD